jgi:hypothetical protein
LRKRLAAAGKVIGILINARMAARLRERLDVAAAV